MKLYLKVALALALLATPAHAQDFLGNLPTNSVVGRDTAGTGQAEVILESAFKTMFNLVPGTNIQAFDADLASVAAAATTAAGISCLTFADPNADRIIGWDDSLGSCREMPLANILTEAAPATGDFVLIYGAEGDLRKVNWSSLPGSAGGIASVSADPAPTLGGNLSTSTFNIDMGNGTAIRTTTTAGNTYNLQARDVDGAVYTTFATLTANNTPTMDLSDSVTKGGGNYIYRAGGTDVPIGDGGTSGTNTDPNADRVVAWDDSAGRMSIMALTDFLDEPTPATGDYLLIYGAEGDLRRANWSTLPGAGSAAPTGAGYVTDAADATLTAERVATDTATVDVDTGTASQMKWNVLAAAFTTLCGADPNADRLAFWDDSAGACAYLTPPANFTISGTTATIRENFIVAASDETTAITAATSKVKWRMPYAFTLTGVRCNLNVAQTAGSLFTVDINESGVSVLSTKVTIDNNELTSTTAATAPVISDTALADDAEMSIDVDLVGTGSPAGLKCELIGNQ